MWTDRKSILLTILCTWITIVIDVTFAALLQLLPKFFPETNVILSDIFRLEAALPSFYTCCAVMMVSLITFLRLLLDLRKELVFTRANVRRLRVISWCSFAIFVILVLTAIFLASSPAILLIAAASGFFCLLLRVIKNVINAARLLKEESDYII
jgi:hypothetical protein